MDFTCDACGTSKDHDRSSGNVPPGWRYQRVARRVVVLCDSCSFLCPRDAASPMLVEQLRARGINIHGTDAYGKRGR